MENTTILNIDMAEKRLHEELRGIEHCLKRTLEILKSGAIKLHRRSDILDYQVSTLIASVARISFLLELLEDQGIDYLYLENEEKRKND